VGGAVGMPEREVGRRFREVIDDQSVGRSVSPSLSFRCVCKRRELGVLSRRSARPVIQVDFACTTYLLGDGEVSLQLQIQGVVRPHLCQSKSMMMRWVGGHVMKPTDIVAGRKG
jgi:hypothetical protein